MADFRTAFRHFDGLVRADQSASLFLVANNPDFDISKISGAVRSEKDYVCQFNKCIFAHQLLPLDTKSIFFFSTNSDGIPHGFEPSGLPSKELPQFPAGSLGFILKYPESANPPFLGARQVHSCSNIAIPVIDTNVAIKAAAEIQQQILPSAGFVATSLLSLVNCLRIVSGKEPHQIILAGFSGRYPSGNPFVHDFDGEQEYYRNNPFVSIFEGSEGNSKYSSTTNDFAIRTLKGRFNEHYDFTAATKAQIITDISEVFFKTGDLEFFQKLLGAAISVNPVSAGRQIGLLISSMSAESADPSSHAFLENVRSMSHNRARELNTKWTQGKIKWAPVKNPDISSSDCEFRLRTSDRPRVLVLNETSKIGFNDKHLGCYNVSRTIFSMLDKYGMEYAGWANSISGFSEIIEGKEGRDFDALLINGEGTFQGNASRAIELAMIGQYAKTLGKKVFLLNSVWEWNGRQLEELCSNFDLITVRESWSLQEVKGFFPRALLVPDLVWNYMPTNLCPNATGECAVVDCILPDVTAALQDLAVANSLEFRTMSGLLRPFARSIQNNHPAKSIPSALCEADLRHFSSWISGRFHGIILALAHLSPVAAFQSNTKKVQAMLGDIGISHKICSGEDIQESTTAGKLCDSILDKLEYSEADWRNIAIYKTNAISRTNELFKIIGNMI
ncbi:polysaccharide pyruvyl transferase family protein [Rhizobium mongolense]|uniref:polysaccharide pyruvyl transferase family protein n=1 Tax=Rhizobium mongolense TaxID=57676 RepID=UPI0034A382FA